MLTVSPSSLSKLWRTNQLQETWWVNKYSVSSLIMCWFKLESVLSHGSQVFFFKQSRFSYLEDSSPNFQRSVGCFECNFGRFKSRQSKFKFIKVSVISAWKFLLIYCLFEEAWPLWRCSHRLFKRSLFTNSLYFQSFMLHIWWPDTFVWKSWTGVFDLFHHKTQVRILFFCSQEFSFIFEHIVCLNQSLCDIFVSKGC